MSFSKIIVADQIVAQLIENQGIYSRMNRSFDALARPGATSVDVPKVKVGKVLLAGVSATSADRVRPEQDTSMINVPLTVKSVPLARSVLMAYSDNGTIMTGIVNGAAEVLREHFDVEVLEAAIQTTNKIAITSEKLTWDDITDIATRMDDNKVPKTGRVIVIPTSLAKEFYGIDVIKSAMAYNQQFLQTGSLTNIMGMTFFITALQPKVTVLGAEKSAISGIYGPGLASVIAREGEIKEQWDSETRQDLMDMVAYSGSKLMDNAFCVVGFK